MQPDNTPRDGRPRPSGVPDGAYWDESDNEWVLATKDTEGRFQGLVKWYRPDGTMCCATDHVDGKPHGSFTRFHENGEQSRTGRFVTGTLHGPNVFTRSTAKTTENFPAGLGKHIWRCEMDFVDGKMTEGRLFDHEGRRVMEDGTPFPTDRPRGVAATAHFRKTGGGDYLWVEGATQQVGDDWPKVGTWRYWTAAGVLVREEPYDGGEFHGVVRIYDEDTGSLLEEQRYDHGERRYERPSGVPADAELDTDDEVWRHETATERRTWTAAGVLRQVDTLANGALVRVQEFLADGSPAQDSTIVDDGVPRRKWFRKTGDEELESFPNVADEAREVEYLFDDHGRMRSYRITGEGGAEMESQELYRNARGDEEQMRFGSAAEASAAWTAAGDQYTSELNRWLAELYASEDGETSFEEPTFDRRDLERGVLDAVEELNARGDAAQARALFPLYYDGIGKEFWDRYGFVIDRVLDTGTEVLANVRYPHKPPEVMRITADAIELVPNLRSFGASADKQYIAFAFEDRLELRHGGERITLAYPQRYDHPAADKLETKLGTALVMGVRDVKIAANGRDVVLVTAEGIYAMTPDSVQRLYPLDATFDEYVAEHEGGLFELDVHYANADISPAGDRITCGGMFKRGIMAGLAIYRRTGDAWVLENTSQADAFFPANAVFHRSRPHIAFAATLYASLSNALTNTTFRIDLEDMIPGAIEEFGGGIARERGRVTAVASFGDGFLLGFDNGYIRWMGVEENAQLLGYVFVGGSVLDIDVSPDQKSFVVGSDAGLVTRLTLADKPARNLIATMPVADVSRVGFFRTFPPLRW